MTDTRDARACARPREVTPAPASQEPQLAVWFTPEDIRTSKEGSPYHEKAQAACDEALEEAALEVLSDSDWLWTVYGEICRPRPPRTGRFVRRKCQRLPY